MITLGKYLIKKALQQNPGRRLSVRYLESFYPVNEIHLL